MKFNLIFLLLILFYQTKAQDINYPPTRRDTSSITIHGIKIQDQFQWLENTESKEVIEWVRTQNKVSDKIIKERVNQKRLASWINYYNNYENEYFKDDLELKKTISKDEFKIRYYYTDENRNAGIYIKKESDNFYRALVHPDKFSSKQSIKVVSHALSENKKYLAYEFSRNGSDWTEIRVLSIENESHLVDHIMNVKFSSIIWEGIGFYYVSYKQSGKFSEHDSPSIYYHVLNTTQDKDRLVFKARKPSSNLRIYSIDKNANICIKETDNQNQVNSIFIKKKDENGFRAYFNKLKYDVSVYSLRDSLLYFKAKLNSTDQIFTAPKSNPLKWSVKSPVYDDAQLTSFDQSEQNFFFAYHSFKNPFVLITDYDGNIIKEVAFNSGMCIDNIKYSDNYDRLFIHTSSYIIPNITYKMELDSFSYNEYSVSNLNYSTNDFVFKKTTSISRDGTRIPLYILSHKKTILDENTPFLLSAYGGFGIISKPHFDPGLVYFLRRGGAYAFSSIRGGGELGNVWAKNGRNLLKQNSIDDFISAADFLINNKYTSSEKLAITGSSHGGLIVSAAMIQRPKLFRLVVPQVGVYDMVNYEKFTIGKVHQDEFGSIDNFEEFQNLYSYSPFHNISDTVNYPTTLIITSSDDDRAPPIHSYKFVAKLQKREVQKNPILLHQRKKSGHQGPSTFKGFKRNKAVVYGFILDYLLDE